MKDEVGMARYNRDNPTARDKGNSMPLHPTVKKIIRTAYKMDFDNLHQRPIEEVRTFFQKGIDIDDRIDQSAIETIQLKGGASLRLHRPQNIQHDGVVFYIKACGYTFGKPTDADLACYRLSNYLKCTVASIEHRLAPEFQFPLPFYDCANAIEHLYHYHQKYDLNPQKFTSWGESSGANLSAGVAHYFRDQGEQLLKKQILFYPPLDYSKQYISNKKFGLGFLTDITISDYFIRHYVKDEADLAHPYVSPLCHNNFKGLPEQVIMTAEYDLFADEHVAYVKKVLQADGDIHIMFALGLVHGYLWHQKHIKDVMFFNQFAADELAVAIA